MSNLHVLTHPLVKAQLSALRQVTTTPKEFREVGLLIIPIFAIKSGQGRA
jgi:uracil phosphoribosyltransferase